MGLMRIPIPKERYIKGIDVNEGHLDVNFAKRKKVALLFISLNANYWPYAKQVIEDCRVNFLPQHKVDYFVWTDMPETELSGVTIVPTEPIEWPHPTLMRYHLFLNEEEKLKEYDYVFYLDADMRVVQKISDEILGNDLTVALHPMYDLNPTFVPPYEPNPQSTAFIPRLSQIIDDKGKPRLRPLYLAGGFQGGTSKAFLKAMRSMKRAIDKDFNANYTAIWNDESHWNKYVFTTRGPILPSSVIVLGPEYIYPDSLIREYYEPRWGRKLEPKIITLTKPFSISAEGAAGLNEILGNNSATGEAFTCDTCKDTFKVIGHKVNRVIVCPGTGKPHELDMTRI